MLFFGHRFIKSEKFYHVFDIDTIANTPSNSTIYLDYCEKNLDIITYLNENNIRFALKVSNITEVVYAAALNATYIVVMQNLAKTTQKIAETYLFDAKILAHVDNEEDIEELALLGIDGVICPSAVVKLSS
jgi:hypothetical protein